MQNLWTAMHNFEFAIQKRTLHSSFAMQKIWMKSFSGCVYNKACSSNFVGNIKQFFYEI